MSLKVDKLHFFRIAGRKTLFMIRNSLVKCIGDVVALTGVPLRYWEDTDIIASIAEGKTRRFDCVNIKKVLLSKELLKEGYTPEKQHGQDQ